MEAEAVDANVAFLTTHDVLAGAKRHHVGNAFVFTVFVLDGGGDAFTVVANDDVHARTERGVKDDPDVPSTGVEGVVHELAHGVVDGEATVELTAEEVGGDDKGYVSTFHSVQPPLFEFVLSLWTSDGFDTMLWAVRAGQVEATWRVRVSLVHDGVSIVVPQQALHLEDFLNRAPVVYLEGWPFLSAGVSAQTFMKLGGGTSDVASDEPICPVKFAENVCSNAGPHHVLRDVVFVQYVRIHNLPSPDVLNPPHDGLRTVSSAPPSYSDGYQYAAFERDFQHHET